MLSWNREKCIFPKVTKMGSIFGHKIDYWWGRGSERTAAHTHQFYSKYSLVLICRRSTCDVAAGTACDATPTYEDITPPVTRNIAGLYRWHAFEAELVSTSQACRRSRLTWPLLPSSTVLLSERYRRQNRQTCRSHVAGSSAAYENQA